MSTFFYSILGFVVAIGLLTAIHEYGHFWVARRLKVKVLRFSIGFGKPLITWFDKLGTEYAICAIPLGGYVKMLDQNEVQVASNELHLAYNNKPVWVRMLIIAAGPISNMLFAVFAYWVVFMLGIASIVPVLGEVPPTSVAYAAGLRSGQEITAIDSHPTSTWEDIVIGLVSHAGDHDQVNVTVRDTQDQAVATHVLNLSNWSLDNEDANLLQDLGLVPYDPAQPIVGKLIPNYPAEHSGLQPGDRIISLDGVAVHTISQLMHVLHDKYDRLVQLKIERANQILTISLTPAKKQQDNGDVSGFIGIQFAPQVWPDKFIRIQHFGPIAALSMAWDRTKEYSVLTVQFLAKMVTGKISLQHISGPIAIAQYAGITARSGIENFLGFLALVSISLGILNMLPIPVLDGGHFLFCVIELIRGKALSVRAMNVGFAFGIILLGSVMLLAIYNDVVRIMH